MPISRVLIDTSAYFALADPGDSRHVAASRIVHRLASEPSRLFTTNFIVAETHALLLARRGRALAFRVLQEMDHSTTAVVRAGAVDELRARAIISRYDDKNFSLTDAISFAVMERLHIPTAFTFDHSFVQYGFPILTPD